MTSESRKLHGIVWGSLWGERMRRSPWTWGSAFIGVESGGLGFQNVHSLLVTLKYEWLFKGENRKSLNKTKIKKPQRLVNKLNQNLWKKKKRLTGEQRWEVQLILQVSGWQSVYWRKASLKWPLLQSNIFFFFLIGFYLFFLILFYF